MSRRTTLATVAAELATALDAPRPSWCTPEAWQAAQHALELLRRDAHAALAGASHARVAEAMGVSRETVARWSSKGWL